MRMGWVVAGLVLGGNLTACARGGIEDAATNLGGGADAAIATGGARGAARSDAAAGTGGAGPGGGGEAGSSGGEAGVGGSGGVSQEGGSAGDPGTCAARDSGAPPGDPSIIYTCGNGIAEGSESCDRNDLRGLTCATVGRGVPPAGQLACSVVCTLDTSGCMLSPPERANVAECMARAPRYCADDAGCGYGCWCETCASQVLRCFDDPACAAMLDCFEEAGCDATTCDSSSQCGAVIAAQGGATSPAATLAFAALACAGGHCRPCCGPPGTSGECLGGAGSCKAATQTAAVTSWHGWPDSACGDYRMCFEQSTLARPVCKRRACGGPGACGVFPAFLGTWVTPAPACGPGAGCVPCATHLGNTGICF